MSRMLLALVATLGVVTVSTADYLTPLSYSLLFQLDLENPDKGFSGSNIINFKSAVDLPRGVTTIQLHSLDLKINVAQLHYPGGKQFTIRNITYNAAEETVDLAVDQELAANSLYKLVIDYEGSLNDTKGFFITQINQENYLGINSYPVHAKRIYPCFDKPHMRAKYDIVLEIHYAKTKDPVIISGLPGSYRIVKKDYNFWLEPKTKYILGNYSSAIDLPPYGFSFFVGNYLQVKPEFSIYVPNDKSYLNVANQDLFDVLSTNIVNDLEKSSDLKMKLVIVPGLPVSNINGYGIAAVSPYYSLESPGFSTRQLRDQALVILKAVLKSFFTAVISPSSWKNVWLAESIPNFIAHAAFNQMTTTWKNWPQIEVLRLQQYALSYSSSASSSPVIPSDFNTTEQVVQFLSNPALVKGAAILGMIETLASNPLSSFVAFINQFKGKAVSTEDFLNFYEEMNGLNKTLPDGKHLTSVVDSWLTLPGYPLLSVFRSDHEVVVNKKTFRNENNNQKSWMIPMSYQTFYLNSSSVSLGVSDKNFVWLDDKDNGNYTVLKDPMHNLLVVLNVYEPGPYRVLYDGSSLQYIKEKLSNDLDFISTEFIRATLVGDNFAFAKEGTITYTSLFNTLRYLKNEKSLGPWTIANNGFKDLWTLLYYTDLRVQFQNYVTALMRPTYLKLGIDVESADMEKGMMRKIVISGMCDYSDETCRADTKKAYDTYITGKKSIADSDIVEELYCNGLRELNDGGAIRTLLLQNYKVSLPLYQKKSLFYYLSCSGGEYSNSDAINSLLQDVLVSSKILNMPAEDVVLAFTEIANKPQHYKEALTFFAHQFSDMRADLSDEYRASLIRHLGSLGSTEDHLYIFGNITYDNSSQSIILPAVQDAVKSVQTRMKFLQDRYTDIYQGLFGLDPPPTSPTAPTPSPTPSPTPTSSPTTPAPPSAASTSAAAFLPLIACALILKHLI